MTSDGNIFHVIKYFQDWIMLLLTCRENWKCFILILYNLTSDTFYNSYRVFQQPHSQRGEFMLSVLAGVISRYLILFY